MEKWNDPQTIAFWIIIVCTVMFLLVFTIIRVAYIGFKRIIQAEIDESNMKLDHQKKLLETSILAQEKERTRIAADLHDALIGKLIGIQLKHQLMRDPEEIDNLLQESISEARRISHDLSPPMIEHKTLGQLIESVVEPWKKNLAISFRQDVRTTNEHDPMIKIHFLRIVQELIINIHKHAEASQVNVHLRCSPKSTLVLVRDNGRGFDETTLEKGIGLSNIELRMQQLGGTHRVKSTPKGVATLLALEHEHETV